MSADRVAALEKDVAKLKTELQQLRHRFEMDAKMLSRAAMQQRPYRPDRPGRLGSGDRIPEDLRNSGFLPHRPPSMREELSKMTPEQRRAWHEEQRKMFEDPAKMTPEQRRAWHEEQRKMREELSKMTPEQRRAWHEERRKMREERRQKMLEERNSRKISEPENQTTNNTKQESK